MRTFPGQQRRAPSLLVRGKPWEDHRGIVRGQRLILLHRSEQLALGRPKRGCSREDWCWPWSRLPRRGCVRRQETQRWPTWHNPPHRRRVWRASNKRLPCKRGLQGETNPMMRGQTHDKRGSETQDTWVSPWTRGSSPDRGSATWDRGSAARNRGSAARNRGSAPRNRGSTPRDRSAVGRPHGIVGQPHALPTAE